MAFTRKKSFVQKRIHNNKNAFSLPKVCPCTVVFRGHSITIRKGDITIAWPANYMAGVAAIIGVQLYTAAATRILKKKNRMDGAKMGKKKTSLVGLLLLKSRIRVQPSID